MKEPGVNLHRANLVIELAGAFALQNYAGNADHVIPHGEIRNGGIAGKRGAESSFQNAARFVPKDLADRDDRMAAVNLDVGVKLGDG